MAAPSGRMLVSIRGGSCWGSIIGTLWRQTSLIRPCVPRNAKPLHTNSELRENLSPHGPDHRMPEYIPQRKANNPMKKVGLAWAIGFPSGIILFLLAKREVDKKRLAQLKVRQRMKDSNQGEYERLRFNRST